MGISSKSGQEYDTAIDLNHINPNIWQGIFSYDHQEKDCYAGVAPVGYFQPNHFILYDMIGNVWDYIQTPFKDSHDDDMGFQLTIDFAA